MSEDLGAFATLEAHREGAMVWLTLNRPGRLNALNAQLVEDLCDLLDLLAIDDTCRVILLRGAGRAFCSGLDLKDVDLPVAPALVDRLPDMIRKMRSCPQPIIALVHGIAAGGGFSLALAADIRIAARDARFNAAFIRLGVSGCELGTSYFLPRMVGMSVASEIMMTGRILDSYRALATGLVSEVVEPDHLDEAGRAMAADMLKASAIGLRKTKETIDRVSRLPDLEAALTLEMQTQQECARHPDFARAVTAFKASLAPDRDKR